MRPLSILARISYGSARWPIQTISIISLAVFVAYVIFVNVAPHSDLGPLSRTFEVLSANNWQPYTRDKSGYSENRYIGASIVLDIPDPDAGLDHENNRATSEAVKKAREHIYSMLHIEPQVTDKNQSAIMLLSESDYRWAIGQLRSFDLEHGNMWHLEPAFSWVVWTKWYFARLLDLVHETRWFDLCVVGAGWIGMYYTFARLFLGMRKIGSRSYLFFAALISSTFAFLAAYAVTDFIGLVVSKRALVQGLPFFVLVVGFDSKVTLAKESLRFVFESSKATGVQKKPKARRGEDREDDSSAVAVSKAIESSGYQILKEHIMQIGFLSVASFVAKIPELWDFSVLSALILLMDTAFMVTLYAASLSLKLTMVKVERNYEIRRTLLEDGVPTSAVERYTESSDAYLANSTAAIMAGNRHRGFLSLRLAILSVIMVYNYLQITAFPISFFVHIADLKSSPAVTDYISKLVYPSLLTVLPPLRFSPTPSNPYFSNYTGIRGLIIAVEKVAHSEPASRMALVALAFSLMLNGYLVSLSRKNAASVEVVEHKVPVVVERRLPSAEAELVGSAPNGNSLLVHDLETAAATEESGASTRTSEDRLAIVKAGLASELTNDELVELGVSKQLPLYALEKMLKDATRAVVVRRAIISRLSRTKTLESSLLPWRDYDYDRVLGACCENVVGYLPLPLGIAGPVIIDGQETYLPMATTEGVLVASTMRGCKALNGGGGVTTQILTDGMTRGPCVTFASAARASDAKRWLDSPEGWATMQKAFDSTSRFARLQGVKTAQAGVFLYIRFRAQTGDAMGMNMISKGVERALQVMATDCGFDDMSIVSVSGNYCTDKKATALNWIDGRGKSVVAEAVVPGDLVKSILKTSVDELVELNMAKNLVGSAMAGATGGFNAQAANLVAAIFLATGQDPAQVVEGSNCITLMSNVDGNLQISVSMPSLEVGTIGGGTILEPQAAMLDMLGIKGPHPTQPGDNARQLARVVATGVLAGELSLCSALAAGHLVKSHMAHNRAKPVTDISSTSSTRSSSKPAVAGSATKVMNGKAHS